MKQRVLADTGIWIDHLRVRDERLAAVHGERRLLCHPFVRGEVLLGSIRNRAAVSRDLKLLPQAVMARNDEVFQLLDNARLFGRGIGFVDLHLAASVLITPQTCLWTRDKRLLAVAEELGVAYAPDH